MSTKTKKGFTLIELIVVVAIISLLSSIVISSLNVAKQKSADTAKIRVLQEFRTALNMYYNDNGSYPGSTATELAKLTGGTTKYISSVNSNIKYKGRQSNLPTASDCTTNCPAYIAAIQLARTDNKIIYGQSAECEKFTPPIPNCYFISSK